jgi:3-methylcrotonyl-CoA carboxylase alpha subunit
VIASLLIANRGEIACRIIRTARRLGIRTIAVYSDADAEALHVRMADEAVHIGPSPARESYLVGDKIIAAAQATRAEAIHPGYGFLSENADFAQAVIDSGLIWVGPKPDSIRAMGLKDAAKKLMIEAGVPVTPGYLGEDQSPERLRKEADAIGYPVLIKAVAGGGGKGMRKVNEATDFPDMLQSCRREASAAFGDDRVLLEKYVERPRHIEVQVFGDTHGNVVHLFERDCSLQRRHQKVIEEAPAPGMDEATRTAICDSAVKAARAVDYVGAGTIEFIADASERLRADRIWFMEMNTRLQVEHPVTEAITGQDLVEWQLRVASGETLPKRQDELSINGWAMEARLYAEDPANGFLPSTGQLELLRLETYLDRFDEGDGIRVDTGVEQGSEIGPYYDPMIAKMIAHSEGREGAAELLALALERSLVFPVRTNGAFVARALRHPEFIAGKVDTGFIPRNLEALLEEAPISEDELGAVAARIVQPGGWTIYAPLSNLATLGYGPVWERRSGFRLNAAPDKRIWISSASGIHVARLPEFDRGDSRVDRAGPGQVVLTHKGEAVAFSLAGYAATDGGMAAGDGSIVSPMPGRVIAVDVRQGDKVTKGQKLLTLEAMKMEHSLAAPFDGIVAELNAAEGAQVTEGTLLARIEKGEG